MSTQNVGRSAPGEREPVRSPEARSLLLLLGATVAVNIGPLIPVAAIRAAVVLPVALLAPGYALLVLLADPRGGGGDPLSVASSVLLSMSVYPLLALVLYISSITLSATSVAAGVTVLLLAASAVAATRARRWNRVAASAFAPVPPVRWGFGSSAPTLALGVMLAVALVLGVRAMPDSRIPEPHHGLYLAGAGARMGGFAGADPGERLAVPVGVVNGTDQTEHYEVRARLQRGGAWASRNVTLAPGARWHGKVAGEVPGASCLNRLTISLRTGAGRTDVATIGIWLKTRSGEEERCVARG